VGGVATAARLAKAGFDVTVLEKNDFTGGRCSLIHHEGYVRPVSQLTITVSIDTGPDSL
jgi:phytoene dehydrogenase-like protein